MKKTSGSSVQPHHLVSLLYSIEGMAGVHRDKVNDGVFENETDRLRHAEEILRKNETQAERALQITKRLRELSQERTHPEGNPSASLKNAWEAAKRLLQKEASFSEVEFIERIPSDFPCLVVDPSDLKEILYEIAKNALEAIAGKGKLVIRAELAFSTQEEHFARIQIADTGPGIAEPVLRNLFEPFFTTESPERGNGLGLYVTRQLVRRNRGRISVSSFPHFGTTFTLEFPLSK